MKVWKFVRWLLQAIKVKDYGVSENDGCSEDDEKWSDSGYIWRESNGKIWYMKTREKSRMTPRSLASATRWMKCLSIKMEKYIDRYRELIFGHVV